MAIDLSRRDSPKPSVRLGACDEEGLCLMPHVQPGEVPIASSHDVERPGLQHHDVEHSDVAQLVVGDVGEAGNVAAQVPQRLHLHGGLGGVNQRKGKERVSFSAPSRDEYSAELGLGSGYPLHPIQRNRGFVSVFAVMDWVSRRVFLWRRSNTLTTDFWLEAIQEAING